MYQEPDPNERKYDLPGGGTGDLDFDDPNAMDQAKDIAGDAGELIKKNWWKALVIIILLGGLFFAYDYFVGSIRPVSFRISDTEGSLLSGVGIKVFDSSGSEIERIGGSQTISLRRGDYTVNVTLSGYKLKRGISISAEDIDSGTIEVELEKDWDIELEIGDFQSQIFEGEKTGTFVTIRNNKQSEEQITLKFEGAFDNRYVSTSYPSPVIATPGEVRVFVEMNFKENLKSSLIKDGLKGTIRITGLNNSKARKQVSFDLKDFDRKKIRLSGSLSFGTITEGSPGRQRDITIENKFDFPIEGVKFEVDIKNTDFSNPGDVETWFSFDREVPIDISAGDRTDVGIIVKVPIGIAFEEGATKETISGKLLVSTSFWEEDIDIILTAEKSDVELKLSGLSSSVTMSFDTSTQQYNPKPGILKLRNQGDLPLKLVNISTDCETTGNWVPTNVINFNQTLFEEIGVGEEKQTNYTIELPNAADKADIVGCTLIANYDDPRGGIDRLSTEFAVNIIVR